MNSLVLVDAPKDPKRDSGGRTPGAFKTVAGWWIFVTIDPGDLLASVSTAHSLCTTVTTLASATTRHQDGEAIDVAMSSNCRHRHSRSRGAKVVPHFL